MRSSLSRYAPAMRDPDPTEQRKVAHELWHKHKILVVLPADAKGTDAVWVEAIGRKLYGKQEG